MNKTLVNLLEMQGGKAMGISGMDGRLIESKPKDERLGYVGDITKIHIRPVVDLLEKGYIPVVSTIGCDRQGNAYNINGGMIPKVNCCIEAIHKGVKNVVIMDGRVPHSILMEILTDEGAGTMVKGE